MTPWIRIAAGLAATLFLFVPILAQDPSEADAPDTRAAQVTFLAGSSVYIDAGRAEGLGAGDRVEVVRDDEIVAILIVTDLSTHRASCSIDSASAAVQVGDAVRFVPARPAAASSADTAPSKAPARRRAGWFRGRVGVRYLVVKDRGPSEAGFSQPSLDVRLDGRAVGGRPLDFAVDVRSRRTHRTGATDDDGTTRVYRLASSWSSEGGMRLTMGRQFSPTLAVVSIFDGMMLDFNKERWSAGAFSGSQPDPADFGFSSSVREHGAYFQIRQRNPGPRRWSFATGVIGSYQEGEINREFVSLQGLFHGKRLSAYLTQELDYNRGWKAEAGESTVGTTNSFASLRYRVGRRFTLYGGYDNRRNPRLYRDLVTPVTDFDDSFRRGVWVGTDLGFGDHFHMGFSARSSSGGSSGDADVYTATFGLRGVTSRGLALHSRSTNYTSDQTEGWLHSFSVGMNPGTGLHIELIGGIRDDEFRLDPQLGTSLTWYGIDLEVSLAKRLFLLLSVERSDGDREEYDQLYTSLSYRF